jgi:hypothetical protein
LLRIARRDSIGFNRAVRGQPEAMPISPLTTKLPITDQSVMAVG